MTGKHSLDKGKRFERFVVHALSVCFPDARRGQQSHNPRDCDVEGTSFRIEAKHWARLTYKNVQQAIEQAVENGQRFNDPRVPIAITKLDGQEPLVHTTLRHFLQLVELHFWREPEGVIPILKYKKVAEGRETVPAETYPGCVECDPDGLNGRLEEA
jgi:hypothetical protein